MPWLKLRLRTDSRHALTFAATLETLGAESVTLEDAGDELQVACDSPDISAWRDTWVSGLFTADNQPEILMQQLATECALGGLPPYEIEHVSDQDWTRSWMDRYRPLRFGRRLWVCPSWLSAPDADAPTVMLDPGLAFGTGTHSTTALCLEWLERQPTAAKTFIDYGCGSGILAIAALKLGAQRAIGVDSDPQALAVSAENARRNGVDADLLLTAPDRLPSSLQADVVMANILAGPLMALAEKLSGLVRPGGDLILSGLLATQIDEVSSHYVQDFEMTSETREEWALVCGRKRTLQT